MGPVKVLMDLLGRLTGSDLVLLRVYSRVYLCKA